MLENFESKSGPIIVLDLANNHNGSAELGRRIISEAAAVTSKFPFEVFIKFQYRNLETFIHEQYKGNWNYKYVKRFEQTRLRDDDFKMLVEHARNLGLGVACTPFDEDSVRKVVEHDFDFLKIASVSLNDWPLLEEIAKSGMSVVASTGGATLEEIDLATTFLNKRVNALALMHCVAAYPTKDEDLNLNRIDDLKSRYKDITIGYSTHEHPENVLAAPLAIAKGARILERHIGVENDLEELNAYSSSPHSLKLWLESVLNSIKMFGEGIATVQANVSEQESLRGLRRGVYLRKGVKEGQILDSDDVAFAIPLLPGQMSVNDWSKTKSHRMLIERLEESPLLSSEVESQSTKDLLSQIGEDAKKLFSAGGVTLPNFAKLEISHHFGIENFYTYGMLMITVINREYCKKILGLFENQTNPEHRHDVKEETFICIWGTAQVTQDGQIHTLHPGDTLTVSPGVRHSISTKTGAVLEEISTKHNPNDSIYTDDRINRTKNRKSSVSLWN
jgi:sialic acid synthase SpsE/D-lyxose ketol-isomerase